MPSPYHVVNSFSSTLQTRFLLESLLWTQVDLFKFYVRTQSTVYIVMCFEGYVEAYLDFESLVAQLILSSWATHCPHLRNPCKCPLWILDTLRALLHSYMQLRLIFFCQTSAQFSITQQNKSFGYLSTHNNNKAQNIRNMSQHSKETPNILKNLKIMIGIWISKNLWMIIDNGKEITGCHSNQVANHRNFMNTVYPNDKCSILNHDCLF